MMIGTGVMFGGFNADMHWFAAMAALFVIGVVINVYGRIKAARWAGLAA